MITTDTIKKYWKGEKDVFEVAARIKYEIENAPDDLIGKEKLELVISFIDPGSNIPVYPESHDKIDLENKDVALKKEEHVQENTNVIEKKLFIYNPNLYYVRDSGCYSELIDKETDLPVLILDKNNYTFTSGKTNTFKEMEINNTRQKNNDIESIQPKIDNNIIEKEIIEYDDNLYNLKENGEFFFLISKKNNLNNKKYNKKYYLLKNKLFDDNIQRIISTKNNNFMEVFTGKKPKTLKFNNITYEVTTWREVLLSITKQIHNEKNNFYEVNKIRGSKNIYFSKDLKDKKHGGEINVPIRIPGTQYCFEGKISANQTMKIVYQLLKLFGYNSSDLEIIFHDENKFSE